MNMLLGEKLKKARKNIGMSQNEVAEELMLSKRDYQLQVIHPLSVARMGATTL